MGKQNVGNEGFIRMNKKIGEGNYIKYLHFEEAQIQASFHLKKNCFATGAIGERK